jgi:hypothetical protein
VAQCEKLLGDRARISAMSEANRRYFDEWVRPTAHTMKILNLSFTFYAGIFGLQKFVLTPIISEIALIV